MSRFEIATLAGGCFWCLEAVYLDMEGVTKVESGYMGGQIPNPTYEQVCGGATGHAEVVQVTFSPEITNYREILEVFFTIHDPTTLNRQGNDVGTQYRSAIFYHSEEQRAAAEQIVHEVDNVRLWDDRVVTKLEPASEFYVAENYHQDYYKRNSLQPYCLFVVRPKLQKFRSKFAHKMKQNA
ncbi:MAG TPA: peptide-methionine (S)-S-oxide reductase MsrA [Bryobacteraceae bacterium]|nr:peptide-methionine (S)-S-oxide reductase MsrA [Bryobacteraceae bacterium]